MPKQRSFEKYGYFDDKAREFVITNPYPPRPWMNYIGNTRMMAILDEGAGGMVYYGNSATGRITRQHQFRSVPVGQPGPWVYIREKNGTLWSPSFHPCRTELTDWKCRHGMGYTTYEGTYKGLTAELTYFVAQDDDVMLWDLRLRNNRSRPIDVTVTPYAEFSFLYASEEMLNFHWSKGTVKFVYDHKLEAIKYHYAHKYSPRRFPVFFSASRVPDSFTCSRAAFIGRTGTYADPEAMQAGKLGGEELGAGGMGIGAMNFKAKAAPGKSWRVVTVLGATEEWKDSDRLIRKYRKVSAVDQQRRKLNDFFAEYNGVFQAKLPDADMERFVNTWSPYNCRQAFDRMRAASSIHTGCEGDDAGGIRTRDTMQDLQAVAHLKPDMVRGVLETTFSYQHPQGCLPDQFDPDLTARQDFKPHTHNRGDNGVWPVFTTYAYVTETGDLAFLKEKIAYYKSEKKVSVFDHLWQGLKYIAARNGKHGLSQLWRGDWNDEIKIYAQEGSESVMTSQQLVFACRLLIDLAEATRRKEPVAWCKRVIKRMTDNLNTDTVWDGKWYRRAIPADDKIIPLGSAKRKELKLYPNAQSWAVISGTATPERGVKGMEAVWKHTAEPFGIKMCWPAATGTPEPPAPLLSKYPGFGENGGVFNQPCAWAMMAEALLGRGDQATELYRRCLPPVVCDTVGVDRYQNEPYCFSSHIVAPPQAATGTAELPWLTGTAACMYMAASQYILGIRPTPTGLRISPSIPKAWKGFKVQRRFRGVLYDIEVRNPSGVSAGIASLTLDGKSINGNTIPAVKGKQRVKVIATMGKE